jgi:hypothetical protein
MAEAPKATKMPTTTPCGVSVVKKADASAPSAIMLAKSSSMRRAPNQRSATYPQAMRPPMPPICVADNAKPAATKPYDRSSCKNVTR